MPHRIAAAIYDGLCSFEYSIARELLGRPRPELGVDWYDFLPCRTESGRLFNNHGLEIRPAGSLDDLARADTVLIAGWREPFDAPPGPFLQALQAADQRGARFVSICSGAFALAHAGLLNGAVATTHWLFADRFKERFPQVHLEPDALYLHDEQQGRSVHTSAGCAAGLDLCLALIREDFGVNAANQVARRMVAPVHREGGQTQYAYKQATPIADQSIAPVLDWLEDRLEKPLAVTAIAQHFGYSTRTFQRRFSQRMGCSPTQWLATRRVVKARELLESTDHSIETVAQLSGLGTAANLRKRLADQLATTPRAYRSAFRARTSIGD